MYDVKNLLNSPFELILADGKKVLLPAMGELKNLDIHPMSLDMVKICGFLEVTPNQQAIEPVAEEEESADELDDGLGDLEEDEPEAEVDSEADESTDELDDGLGDLVEGEPVAESEAGSVVEADEPADEPADELDDELDDGLGDLEEDEPEPPKTKKTSTRKGKK